MCTRPSHVPSSELSVIASFQARENTVCREQCEKKKKKKEWAFLLNEKGTSLTMLCIQQIFEGKK